MRTRSSKGGLQRVARAAALASALLVAAPVSAQTYPAKPIRVIIPIPAGSGMDTVGRLAIQRMGQNMGHTFVPENMNRYVGVATAARAAPDGYTLLVSTDSLPLSALTSTNLTFDPMKDLQMFGTIARAVFILSVNPSLPVQTVEDLVRLAKAKPGSIAYGTSGVASPHHVAMEMFAHANGLELLHVPFKGSSETVTALIAGTIQAAMGLPASFTPHIKSGKFRPLAVSSEKRMAAFPEVPTLMERSAIKGVEYESWWGLFAPGGTPRPIVERLHAELGKVLRDKAYTDETLVKMGLEPFEQPSAAAAAALVRAYYDKLAPVVKKAGIKVE